MDKIEFYTGTNISNIFKNKKSLTILVNLFPNERLEIKRWKLSNRQLQNKTLQIIKTVKAQQSTQNYTTLDDDQKYGRKRLGRR